MRTWVLSVVTDSNIEQRFPPREQSRNSLYEGLFNSQRPTCIVSGFPVHPADMLEVSPSVSMSMSMSMSMSNFKNLRI